MATEKVSGSQIVSKDLIVGGKSTVRNTAQFDRGVVIKGWLDAPNIKHAYKGLYQTADDLKAAYPKPLRGWYAAVADYEIVENPDEGTTTKTLEGDAVLYVEYGGSWVPTNMTTTQLNDYVEHFETELDDLSDRTEALEETLNGTSETEGALAKLEALMKDFDEKAWRTDVVVYDGSNNHNGVMSYGMAAQLDRLHRMSAHISYFVEDSSGMTFMSGKPEGAVRAILYLEDKKTFVASTVDTSNPTEVYSEWDANDGDGFHASSIYMGSGSTPISKLYHCGSLAYIWDAKFQEMRLISSLSKYIGEDDVVTSEKAGIMSVEDKKKLDSLSTDVATTTKNGLMSSVDKTKLDGLIETLATEEKDGYMSSVDKTKLDGLIETLATEEKDGYMSSVDKTKLDGLIETLATEEKDGYMSSADKTKLDELTTDVATEEKKGYMSACDKKKANMVDKLVLGGMITNGTMRFDTYCCTERIKGELDEETECTEWDGIIYLSDRKLFAAFVEVDRLVDCGEAYATFKFYTHWSGACLYMENVGEDGGIWKNKVYIHAGTTYQWKNCADDGKGQLLPSGDGVELSRPTEEQLQALVDDFQFVEPGEVTGLASIDVVAAEPLVGKVTKDEQGNATLNLSITEVTEDEINEITGKE